MTCTGTSKSIFSYTDYRAYLRDWLAGEKKRQPRFSLRDFSRQAGIDEGNLSRILSGKRNLTIAASLKLADALGLRKRERDFLHLMVRYEKETEHQSKKSLLERILSYRETRTAIIPPDMYEFYDKWYYTAVREALSFFSYDGTNARELGRAIVPSITSKQVRQAIDLLLRLRLVQIDDTGVYQRTSSVISTGHDVKSIVLNNFILATMDLAKNAINAMPGQINLSSLALTISRRDYEAIQEELRECRARILDIARRSEHADRVYALNMHLFPLARQSGEVQP